MSVLLSVNSLKSIYLDYLFGLNYWTTNTLFIFVFISLFFPKFLRVFFLFFMNFFAKVKTLPLFFVKKQLPSALFFGTLVIHPVLYYLFTVVFVIKFCRFLPRINYVVMPLTKLFLSKVLMATLLLGGLWGLQSTVWGYFWVNDSVEWLLLCLILYTLFNIHVFSSAFLKHNKFILIFFLLNIVLIVRLNLFQTRHSFIEQQSLVFMIMLIYYYIYQTFIKYTFSRSSCLDLFTGTNCKSFFLLIAFFTVLFNVLTLKYSFIVVSVFFLNQLRPGFLMSKIYFHLIFISFFYCWNIYFTFFFLFYQKVQNSLIDIPCMFTDMFVYSQYISKKVNTFVLLEHVTFDVSEDFLRQFKIKFNTILFVKLNNPYLFVYLVLFSL